MTLNTVVAIATLISIVLGFAAVFIRAGRLIQVAEDTREELKEHKKADESRFQSIEGRI
jgi:hypothetical protein